MRLRHILIIVLAVIGLISYAVIQGIFIPQQEIKQQQYDAAQQSPVTHDLNRILPYKSKYMGDASNISNLFQHLPLADIQNTFELQSDVLLAQINYSAESTTLDAVELNKSLFYNSVAAFALIDNLETIIYHFEDTDFRAERADVEQMYGAPLSNLLTLDQWKDKVQDTIAQDNTLDYDQIIRLAPQSS